jgi:hypothetical protein
LRDILCGKIYGDNSEERLKRLGVLINECDYLWAHFPDDTGSKLKSCCGCEKALEKASSKELSFLKRLSYECFQALFLLDSQ